MDKIKEVDTLPFLLIAVLISCSSSNKTPTRGYSLRSYILSGAFHACRLSLILSRGGSWISPHLARNLRDVMLMLALVLLPFLETQENFDGYCPADIYSKFQSLIPSTLFYFYFLETLKPCLVARRLWLKGQEKIYGG